jgi:hypothetical protein
MIRGARAEVGSNQATISGSECIINNINAVNAAIKLLSFFEDELLAQSFLILECPLKFR